MSAKSLRQLITPKAKTFWRKLHVYTLILRGQWSQFITLCTQVLGSQSAEIHCFKS